MKALTAAAAAAAAAGAAQCSKAQQVQAQLQKPRIRDKMMCLADSPSFDHLYPRNLVQLFEGTTQLYPVTQQHLAVALSLADVG
ncbi:uncharacterized protein F4812DRAFT_457031 [Daldinia caldariorum]|uniref:uncharacterized protein n=1 Tax=Daldinia caldariorum TaxID=326644 RepID=UPI0020074FCD|nr:uncharacterized protein F4812DRAFT_457031 [Daldinia caldariorum]KAI1469631.1 hypothetical protein F4812DRAFT_457031 [Daldinia caldariorum]